eukprot:3858551-Amphidinium_carterae.1
MLCCSLAEDADAEKAKFLELLPVKVQVDGSNVAISSVVMQCREPKHGDSIERELLCRFPQDCGWQIGGKNQGRNLMLATSSENTNAKEFPSALRGRCWGGVLVGSLPNSEDMRADMLQKGARDE